MVKAVVGIGVIVVVVVTVVVVMVMAVEISALRQSLRKIQAKV